MNPKNDPPKTLHKRADVPNQNDKTCKRKCDVLNRKHVMPVCAAPTQAVRAPSGEMVQISRRRFLELSTAATAAGLAAAAGLPCCTQKSKKPNERSAEKKQSEAETRASGGAPARENARPRAAEKAPPKQPARKIAGRGHVFSAVHTNLHDSKGHPAIAPVETLLDHLMRELTGKSTVKEAWAALFKSNEVVALKPNTLGRDPCSPSPALLAVIIKKLGQIGIPPQKIVIWDRGHFAHTRLWSSLRKGKTQVKLHSRWGYEKRTRRLPSGGSVHLNKALLKADAVINIPVFKDHSSAGMTGALKNMAFGSVDRPWDHHSKACNPGIPEIYNLSPIKDKVRLIVTDGAQVLYQGGPHGNNRYNVKHNGLYVSRDPVAMDRIIWDTIDGVRKNKGKKVLMKRGSKHHGRPIHVRHAAKIGLGEVDLSKIKHKKKQFS
jgi:uncharacterized protein (DUF362 family)